MSIRNLIAMDTRYVPEHKLPPLFKARWLADLRINSERKATGALQQWAYPAEQRLPLVPYNDIRLERNCCVGRAAKLCALSVDDSMTHISDALPDPDVVNEDIYADDPEWLVAVKVIYAHESYLIDWNDLRFNVAEDYPWQKVINYIEEYM